jgi:GNAT superfamily N-acetyltransferase
MIIRPAKANDAESLFELTLGLINDHAPDFQHSLSVEAIQTAGFGDDPLFEAFVAERADGAIVGCVSFFRGYSGWRAKPAAVVHLLFVREEATRKGIARRLMAAVASVAIERGWSRIDLFVNDGRPAIKFYEAIGMADRHHRHYQIDGDAMRELAGHLQD